MSDFVRIAETASQKGKLDERKEGGKKEELEASSDTSLRWFYSSSSF